MVDKPILNNEESIRLTILDILSETALLPIKKELNTIREELNVIREELAAIKAMLVPPMLEMLKVQPEPVTTQTDISKIGSDFVDTPVDESLNNVPGPTYRVSYILRSPNYNSQYSHCDLYDILSFLAAEKYITGTPHKYNKNPGKMTFWNIRVLKRGEKVLGLSRRGKNGEIVRSTDSLYCNRDFCRKVILPYLFDLEMSRKIANTNQEVIV